MSQLFPGGNPTKPDVQTLQISPTPVALGPGVIGTALTQTINLTAIGINVVVSSVTLLGPGTAWLMSGPGSIPGTINRNASTTINVSITEPGNGTYNGSITLVTNIGTFVIPLSAIFAAGLVALNALNFAINKPGTTGTILSMSQVGTLVTAVLAQPFSYSGVAAVLIQTGVVGYDGVWLMSTPYPGSTIQFNVTATGLAPFVSGVTQPPGLVIALTAANIAFKNPSGSTVNITSITLSDSNFMFASTLTFPIVLVAGATVILLVYYNQAELGQVTLTLTVNNNSSNPVIVLTATAFTVSVFSYSPLAGLTKKLTWGDTLGDSFAADNIPGVAAAFGILQFNDPLWNNPGNEKILQRLEVFYENYGVCTLTLNIQVWRPSANGGAGEYDSVTVTIVIGDASSDLSDRSAYFDVQKSGEIIIATVLRPLLVGGVPNGSCSLTGFTPWFTDSGQKVEDQ